MPPTDSRAEIQYLLARCRLLVDSFAADPDFTLADQLRTIIAETAAAENRRGMRTLRRDLLDMSRALLSDGRPALQIALDKQALEDPFRPRGV